jgi:nucleoporin POM152
MAKLTSSRSAVLNLDETPFCIGPGQNVAKIPIQFNASIPAEISIIRIDLDSMQSESLKISRSDVRHIARSIRGQPDSSVAFYTWEYHARKTGIYRLESVLDEYKLEVKRQTRDTYVVPCPRAKIVTTAESSKRCTRDLSDMSLEVEGTPPLTIAYSRTINGKDHSFHLQSLQPDDFSSPLLGSSSSLVLTDDEDFSWVRPRAVKVVMNETLNSAGEWVYSVDEVSDVFGNTVKYSQSGEDADLRPKPKHLLQKFDVKERPKVSLRGCDLRNPMKVGKGKMTSLPVYYVISGRGPEDTSHKITWEFSPIDTLTNGGDHGSVVSVGSHLAKSSVDKPFISEPGLYTLRSVSSDTCEGEVKEPSSCLLLNPLEPQLTIKAEAIPDKCAGNSIGLRVDLDLIGTPPFVIRYDMVANGIPRMEKIEVAGLRTQLELLPKEAGHHKYIFKSMDDQYYPGTILTGPDMVLEQDVKPAASASIYRPLSSVNACLEEEVEIEIMLLGDAPFTLEYDLIYDGRRKSHKITDIEKSGIYKIKTPALAKGGEYILALGSVQDKAGCRTFLKDELKIAVRRQQPRAAFGLVENKRKIMAVESTKIRLPLRLQGVGPWSISYRNNDGQAVPKTFHSGNDELLVLSRGVYEILDVSDNQCKGIVDPKASTFEVDWYPRPQIALLPTDSVSRSPEGYYVKQEVCEGDIDGFDVSLKGRQHILTSTRHLLTKSKALRHITSNWKRCTSHCKVPAPLVAWKLMLDLTSRRSTWTRKRPATTLTLSPGSLITYTIKRGPQARLSSNKESTRSPQRPLPNPVNHSSTARRSRKLRIRFPSLLPEQLHSTSKWK